MNERSSYTVHGHLIDSVLPPSKHAFRESTLERQRKKVRRGFPLALLLALLISNVLMWGWK